MNLLFWTGSKSQELPQAVRKFLISEFHLVTESLTKLCVLGKNGKSAGRRVRLIRVFDPALLSGIQVSKLKYHNLQEPKYRNALIFEGHIETHGTVQLTDRRPVVSDGLEDTPQFCKASEQDRDVWLDFLEGVSSHEQGGQ